MNRVVITGLGAISSIGLTVEETFAALRESFCGIGSLRFRNAERLSVQIGGQVKNFKPELYFSKQQISLYDKFTQFALIAAQQAISSPLLDNASISGAQGVLVNITGGSDLAIMEVDQATNIIFEGLKMKKLLLLFTVAFMFSCEDEKDSEGSSNSNLLGKWNMTNMGEYEKSMIENATAYNEGGVYNISCLLYTYDAAEEG